MSEAKDPITVESIRVENILAIDELDLQPGKITVARGGNTRGKTSLIEALKTLSGGNDVTLIRDGAKEGTVRVKLSNGIRFTRVVRPKSPTLKVERDMDGAIVKIQKPQEFLNKLMGGGWFNPVEFVTAHKKDRVRTLLESVPLDLDAGFLEEKMRAGWGAQYQSMDGLLCAGHALEVVDRAMLSLSKHGEQLAVSAEDKRRTAEELETQNPAQDIDALKAKHAACENEIKEIGAEGVQLIKDTEGVYDQKVIDLNERSSKECEATVQAVQGQIDDYQKEADEIEKRLQELGDKIQKETMRIVELRRDTKVKASEQAHILKQECDIKTKAIHNEYKAKTDAVIERRTSAVQALEAAQRADENRKTAMKMREESLTLLAGSQSAEQAAQDVTAYREELLKKMPIEGLEVSGGDVLFNGHPFDRLSTREQIRLAVDLSLLNLGDFRFVVIDGVERFDSDSFRELKETLREKNVQALLTRVDDGELKVETENGNIQEKTGKEKTSEETGTEAAQAE